jgi:hypothetical protein
MLASIMSLLSYLTIVCLLFAGGATAASCLIPELTVAGIWGFPVLGFALIVGVIFRIGVYYDPREPETSYPHLNLKVDPTVSFSCYLILASTFDITLNPNTSIPLIAVLIITTAFLMVLFWNNYSDILLITSYKGFSFFFFLRRLSMILSSIIFVVSYAAKLDAVMKGIKPLIIFLTYANCVYFAAIFAGILRESGIRISNRSLRTRLNEWIHISIQPDRFFKSMESLMICIYLTYMGIEIIIRIPNNFQIIPKMILTFVFACGFYICTHYSPRKPTSFVRNLCSFFAICAHVGFAVYLDWYFENVDKISLDRYELHSINILVFHIVIQMLIIWYLSTEFPDLNQYDKVKFVHFCIISIYIFSALSCNVIYILRGSSVAKMIGVKIVDIFYYLATIYLFGLIAGKYREFSQKISDNHPQNVQFPSEIVVV